VLLGNERRWECRGELREGLRAEALNRVQRSRCKWRAGQVADAAIIAGESARGAAVVMCARV
jgi:hypothetical protein